MEPNLLSSGIRHSSLPEKYVRPESDRPHLSEVADCDDVPVIDFGCGDRNLVVKQIAHACREYGFFQRNPALFPPSLRTTSDRPNLSEVVDCNRFNVAGPLHLTAIDWSNSSHRRSVAASLVKGAYVLGGGDLAPPWWEFFGFQLQKSLKDPDDKSIFGAVYELKLSPPDSYFPAAGKPPKYVIAFRGTIMSQVQDLKLDFQYILNTLHTSSRVHIGLQAVHSVISDAGAADGVWLAGHSLGSAIALLIGRNMVLKSGYYLETYLFNPPFPTLPLQLIIKNKKIRRGIRVAHGAVKVGMAVAMKTAARNNKIAQDDKAFASLVQWIPYLFVNPSDHICAEYMEYFQHRERMVAARAGKIARFAASKSIRTMISSAKGKDSEPSHLIPSAYLTINSNPPTDIFAAHELSLWWRPDLELDYKLYQFT